MLRFQLLGALLLVFGGGLLGACQRAGESDVSRSSDGVMRLGAVEVVDTVARSVGPNERPLVLEGLRGSVRVSGEDQRTADLSFVRRGRGDDQDAGRSVMEGISITEQGSEGEYVYTLAADEEDYAAVDVRGTVPRQTALRIDRLSGAVAIDDVEGPLTIAHDHGSVDVEGAAAPVDVTIKNGDIRVDFRRIPAEGSLRLQTANGDIDVGMPPEASVQVDARTNAGTIRTQGLPFSPEQFTPVNAGARYTAELEADGPTLEARTENGSITLRARTAAAADSAQADTGAASEPTVPASDSVVAPPPEPDTGRADTAAAPDTTQ